LTTLQDHGTESGEPSGELKITEVPELPEKEEAKAAEKDWECADTFRFKNGGTKC
jgi:hypothetical protein